MNLRRFIGSKFSWGLFVLMWIGCVGTGQAETTDVPFQAWQLDATSKISLAFASQNNYQPESTFGHVFLVVHQQTPPEPNAKVIEFVGHLESFSDMVATIYGQVDGRYRLLDFSDKSLDYDFENRDLYLLELKVEASKLEKLLTSVAQRMGKPFPYTFAKYNCAYYLALLLEEQGLLTQPVSAQIYVEPVDLMKAVNDRYAGRISFIPSSHRVLSLHLTQLSQAQLLAFNRFTQGDESVLTKENGPLNQTASAYIRYQLPRESEPWRRQYLASSQKQVWHEVTEIDASLPGADTNGHYELSILSGGAVGLKLQPELRNFFGVHTSDQAGAYLDLLSVQAIEKKGRLELSEFTLFKSESINPLTYKSRFLDIGYRNWQSKTGRSDKEAYFTWGMGAAFSIKDVSVALTPTITLGTSNVESQSVNIRAGYRALSEWHGEVWGVRVQTVRRVNSPFQFTREDSMQLRMRVTKQANLGIEFGRIPQLERSFQRFLISYAL